MYNASNFVLNINGSNLIPIVTGGNTILVINVSNEDLSNTLYNFSLQLQLSDGVELVSSSIPVTSQSNNTYQFINIKDLAPNEIKVSYEFELKLNSTYSNGTIIPFTTLLGCEIQASADTMPRGNYDSNNEIISSTEQFQVNVSRYVIYKEVVAGILLGDTIKNKLIIQTSLTEGVALSEIINTIGEGIEYLGNVIITGDSNSDIASYTIQQPTNTVNSYVMLWGTVIIPLASYVTIQYEIRANERYFLNGTESGDYIRNGDTSSCGIAWEDEVTSYSTSYSMILYELLATIQLSRYWVDILVPVIYTLQFRINAYHNITNLSGLLNTSDGQTLSSSSTPAYTQKVVSGSGLTQVLWTLGTGAAGSRNTVVINGTIADSYTSTGLPIYAGDLFTAITSCTGISSTSGLIITSTANHNMQIGIPTISKAITGYFYNNNTPKSGTAVAPGDFVEYLLTYDSSNIQAPSRRNALYDYYPYITNSLSDIEYTDSDPEYPSNAPLLINPNGIMWSTPVVPGGLMFTITALTQIAYSNVANQFLYNLFKQQVVSTSGISYSNRDQVGIQTGKPNLILTTRTTGNNPSMVKIGETYVVTVTLLNDGSASTVTDAFSFTLTQTIPSGVTLLPNTITAGIGTQSLLYTYSNSQIVVRIPQLSPENEVVLKYSVTINNTIAPNQKFYMNTNIAEPYTQLYDISNTNLLYDLVTPT